MNKCVKIDQWLVKKITTLTNPHWYNIINCNNAAFYKNKSLAVGLSISCTNVSVTSPIQLIAVIQNMQIKNYWFLGLF